MFDIFLTLGFLISAKEYCKTVNPSMPNGISCPYHLNESFLVEGLLGDKFQSESIFKSSFCKQTVQNLIRRRIRLIFFTVCRCPIKRNLGVNGLIFTAPICYNFK